MKTEQPILITSIKASENISKNRLVNFSGNYCAQNQPALGVANANASTGEQVPLTVSGIALVLSGGNFSVGAHLTSDSTGKVIATSSLYISIQSGSTPVLADAASPTFGVSGGKLSQTVIGYALDASTSADSLIRVKLL